MIKLFQNGVLLDEEKIPLLTTVLGSTQITLLDVEDWYSNIFAASVVSMCWAQSVVFLYRYPMTKDECTTTPF